MSEFFSLSVSTVLFRPYVFIFLLMYLTAAWFKVGARKAVLFTLSAWVIAYISESSSIRNGIPFGMYCYIPSTTGRELWVCGVPFMDSLSFTFLSYASWSTARALLSPSSGRGLGFRFDSESNRFSPGVVLLGALLFMLIDVVIDPLSLRGDRWFLGRIYYYPTPGPYFGVTIANFVGWFVVGLLSLGVWGVIDRRLADKAQTPRPPALDLWGPALYYIVLLFNLSMTFYIGEPNIGWAGVFMFLPVTVILAFKMGGRAV